MTRSSATRSPRANARRGLYRVDALLGGIVWWAAHLGVSYWLIPRTCLLGSTWPLHALTAVLVALIVRAGWSGAWLIRAGRAELDAGVPEGRRDLWIGWIGLALSIFFGVVTVAEWVPALYLDPCW